MLKDESSERMNVLILPTPFLPTNEVNNKNSSIKTGSNQQKEEKGFSLKIIVLEKVYALYRLSTRPLCHFRVILVLES